MSVDANNCKPICLRLYSKPHLVQSWKIGISDKYIVNINTCLNNRQYNNAYKILRYLITMHLNDHVIKIVSKFIRECDAFYFNIYSMISDICIESFNFDLLCHLLFDEEYGDNFIKVVNVEQIIYDIVDVELISDLEDILQIRIMDGVYDCLEYIIENRTIDWNPIFAKLVFRSNKYSNIIEIINNLNVRINSISEGYVSSHKFNELYKNILV
jgi:hypothetical protein